jgi:hypothetical protein
MVGAFQLMKNGQQVGTFRGEMKSSVDPGGIRFWDVFLRCDMAGLAFGSPTYEIVTPTGARGTCIATKWQDGVLMLNGSGPVPEKVGSV